MTGRKISVFLCAIFTIGLSFCGSISAQSAADQFSIAAGFYSRGQWQDAIVAFEDLINGYPQTEQAKEAYFFLGESQFQESNFPFAKIAYQKFLVHLPQNKFAPRASFRLAEVAYRSKDLQATTLLESFIRENPQSDLIQFAAAYLGETRIQRREPQLAQRVFEMAMTKFPNSSMRDDYELGMGKALQMQGQNENARKYFNQLLQYANPEIRTKAELQVGLLAFAEGDWEAAASHLESCKKSSLDDPSQKVEATFWLARCYLEQQQPEKAISYFQEIATDDVSEELGPAIFFDGAVAWVRAGQLSKAANWLDTIRNRWPGSQWGDDALQMQIELAQRTQNDEQVIQLAKQFDARYPVSPLRNQVKESQGRVHYENLEYVETLKVFQELLERQEPNGDGNSPAQRAKWQYFVGLAHLGLKQYKEAVLALRDLETGEMEQSFQAAVCIARGTALSALEDYSAAIPDYNAYLQLQPNGTDVPRCLAELAISEAEMRNWGEASKSFDQLESRFTRHENVVSTAAVLAAAAYNEQQLTLAARWYEVLIQPENEKAMVGKGLTGLAWVYLKGGDTGRALEHFERILTEFPDTDLAVDAAMARAKQLEDVKNYLEAAKTYELVLARARREKLLDISRLRIAFCLQKVGGESNLLRAQEVLETYLNQETKTQNESEALYQLAWICLDLKQVDKGYRRFSELASDYPKSKYWADAAYRLAEFHFRKKDFGEAQAYAEQLLERTEQKEILVRSIYMLGQMAAMNDQWDQVGQSMQSLIARCDDKGVYAKANYWLAEAMYHKKNYVDAADVFGQLISKNDLLDHTVWPWVALRHSQCQAKLKAWSQVEKISVEAMEKYPDFKLNFEHHYLLGRSREQQGRLTDARTSYETVVQSKRGGKTETAAKAQWRIGETYFHQEKYEAAIKAFYKVDSLFSYPKWRSAALYEAGKCQEHLGNWTQAVILYKQLIREFPICDFVDEATQRLDFASRQAESAATNVKRR